VRKFNLANVNIRGDFRTHEAKGALEGTKKGGDCVLGGVHRPLGHIEDKEAFQERQGSMQGPPHRLSAMHVQGGYVSKREKKACRIGGLIPGRVRCPGGAG